MRRHAGGSAISSLSPIIYGFDLSSPALIGSVKDTRGGIPFLGAAIR